MRRWRVVLSVVRGRNPGKRGLRPRAPACPKHVAAVEYVAFCAELLLIAARISAVCAGAAAAGFRAFVGFSLLALLFF